MDFRPLPPAPAKSVLQSSLHKYLCPRNIDLKSPSAMMMLLCCTVQRDVYTAHAGINIPHQVWKTKVHVPQLARCSMVSGRSQSAVCVGLICLIHHGTHLHKTLCFSKAGVPKRFHVTATETTPAPGWRSTLHRESASIPAEMFTTRSPGSAQTHLNLLTFSRKCCLAAWHGNVCVFFSEHFLLND